MNELLAAVVHDVKNQLAELALRLERRDDSREEAAIAFAAARRLTALLMIQREQAGLLRASIDSAAPADLLEDLAAEYRALFPGLDIGLELDAGPAFWFFDAALLRLALGNALHNACRHAQHRVLLSARVVADRLEIRIGDDGPGFAPDQLGPASTTVPGSAGRAGTGLGLYLAARIAALHENRGQHGEVVLDNGNGAIFLLSLP